MCTRQMQTSDYGRYTYLVSLQSREISTSINILLTSLILVQFSQTIEESRRRYDGLMDSKFDPIRWYRC